MCQLFIIQRKPKIRFRTISQNLFRHIIQIESIILPIKRNERESINGDPLHPLRIYIYLKDKWRD